jgi:hypothetical protein
MLSYRAMLEAKVLPAGQDVTSFVVEHGKESFLEFALS